MKKEYIELHELEVYKISRKLSAIAWEIYNSLDWKMQKLMGDQFLESTDSTGANIAEGYGRFHYLDKIKFYYNSRGSYMEAKEHWLDLMFERKIISQKLYDQYLTEGKYFLIKMNNFISATFEAKQKFQ